MNSSRYRCHDLHKGRVSMPGQIYMITTVTQDRICWFQDFHTGREVAKTLKNATPSADTLAYVVMPDHLHWLMRLKEHYSLAQAIHFVKNTSAKRVNKYLNRTGRIWSKGYFEHALRQEESVIDCARYIVANPLRAGLVKQIGDYPLWDAVWLGD